MDSASSLLKSGVIDEMSARNLCRHDDGGGPMPTLADIVLPQVVGRYLAWYFFLRGVPLPITEGVDWLPKNHKSVLITNVGDDEGFVSWGLLDKWG